MPAQLSQRTVKKATLSPSLGKNPPPQGMLNALDRLSASGTLIQKYNSPDRSERHRHPPFFLPSSVLIHSPRFVQVITALQENLPRHLHYRSGRSSDIIWQ